MASSFQSDFFGKFVRFHTTMASSFLSDFFGKFVRFGTMVVKSMALNFHFSSSDLSLCIVFVVGQDSSSLFHLLS